MSRVKDEKAMKGLLDLQRAVEKDETNKVEHASKDEDKGYESTNVFFQPL